MTNYEKLMAQILGAASDANISFNDLFRKAGIEEKINLQREGNKAKPYQVKQVRAIIANYRLGVRDP
jgi:hypothetical protein